MSDYGKILVSRVGGGVRIDRADPRALISADLLGRAIFDAAGPWLKSDGQTVTFSDSYGARFIYRIGPLVDGVVPLAYEIEWPD